MRKLRKRHTYCDMGKDKVTYKEIETYFKLILKYGMDKEEVQKFKPNTEREREQNERMTDFKKDIAIETERVAIGNRWGRERGKYEYHKHLRRKKEREEGRQRGKEGR